MGLLLVKKVNIEKSSKKSPIHSLLTSGFQWESVQKFWKFARLLNLIWAFRKTTWEVDLRDEYNQWTLRLPFTSIIKIFEWSDWWDILCIFNTNFEFILINKSSIFFIFLNQKNISQDHSYQRIPPTSYKSRERTRQFEPRDDGDAGIFLKVIY